MPKRQPAGICMTPCTTELGRFARERRLLLDMREKAVGKKAQLAQTSISAIETGVWKNLKDEQVTNLATALCCTEIELKKRLPPRKVVPIKPLTPLGEFIQRHQEEIGLMDKRFAKRMGMGLHEIEELKRTKTIKSFKLARQIARASFLHPPMLAKFVAGRRTKPRNTLGRTIRNGRIAQMLGLNEFAKKLEITRQAASLMELGEYKGTDEGMLVRIARVLKLDINKLRAARSERKKTRQPKKKIGTQQEVVVS
jgi:transcriptional regulator with XRE-family HTH domain